MLTSKSSLEHHHLWKAYSRVAKGDAGADLIAFLKVSNLSVVNISSTAETAFQSSFPPDWPEVEL